MAAQRITEVTVTPLSTAYRKELGRNSTYEGIGIYQTEWLVRTRTNGGLEGLTNAKRYMRVFEGFTRPQGRMEGLAGLLRETFLGKRTDEFLEMDGGRAVGVKSGFQEVFKSHGWMNILAFEVYLHIWCFSSPMRLWTRLRTFESAAGLVNIFKQTVTIAQA